MDPRDEWEVGDVVIVSAAGQVYVRVVIDKTDLFVKAASPDAQSTVTEVLRLDTGKPHVPEVRAVGRARYRDWDRWETPEQFQARLDQRSEREARVPIADEIAATYGIQVPLEGGEFPVSLNSLAGLRDWLHEVVWPKRR